MTEIYADYIVLERNAESTRLYVQGKQPAGARDASHLLQVGGPTPKTAGVLPPASNGENSAPPPITDFIRPNPVFEGERLRGLVLYPGERSSVFSKMGLAAGDLVTAVNGVTVTDVEPVMEMLQQLVTGSAFDATVQRGGKVEHVTLDGTWILAERRSPSGSVAWTN